MTFAPGENVGPYRIIEQLGQGGMATVFRAYHPSLDRDVAVKVLHPVFKEDPQFFVRFQREARIVARLEHPNIIPVYDFNEHNGEPYLVMRYVNGDTLKAHLGDSPLSPTEVLRIMRPVCNALAYAHEQGVLHRDIKPSNIMLTRDGNVFLTDFGLARMTQAGESTLSQDMLVGTPQYISPEQAQSLAELDGRADIYSLGVVLFEMLVGNVPYNADTPFAIVHDHIYTPLPLPRSLNPDLDEGVERTLLKALAKEPDERFASADDLLASLESSLGSQIASAPTVASSEAAVSPPLASPRRWPWFVAGAALLLLLAAGVLLALSIFNEEEPAPPPVAAATAAPSDAASEPPAPPSDAVDAPLDSPSRLEEARALHRQAEELAEQGEIEAALETLDQAIELAPGYLPAYLNAGALLFDNGHPEDGLAYFEAGAQAAPNEPEAWFQLSLARALTGDVDGFQEAIHESLALKPDYVPAHTGLALFYLHQDQLDEALAEIETSLKLEPEYAGANLAKALYLFKIGDRPAALRTFREIRRPESVPVLARLVAGQLLNDLGIDLPQRDAPGGGN
ncbi:MAG: protein kinase [Anaerolineae bacterium]